MTGGTGFIGAALVEALLERGAQPIVLSRSPEAARHQFDERVEIVGGDPTELGAWTGAVCGADAVIHLAGEPLAARRWSPAHERRVRDSRLCSTRNLVAAMGACHLDDRPRVLLSASAVDFYPFEEELGGDSERIAEEAPASDSFLGQMCSEWEREALAARQHGVRVACLRTGHVIGPGGGLPLMALPFRFFVGGPLGSGEQWFSWVHRDDVVRAYLFLLDRADVDGSLNLVAPEPVRNRDFAASLAAVLGRPSWMPVPAPLLRLTVGKLALYLLHGRRAVPRKLLSAGFSFRFRNIEAALRAVYGREQPTPPTARRHTVAKVRDVMTQNPICLSVTASAADAARRMREENIGDVIVEKDGQVCGIVTDRDIVVRAIADGHDPSTTALERICSSNLATVSPEDDVETAIELMRNKAIRRVPVIENGRPIGIVALGDLAIDRDPKSVLGDISAASPNG